MRAKRGIMKIKLTEAQLKAMDQAIVALITQGHLRCNEDGPPKAMWERCLMMYAIRGGFPIDETCALAQLAGVSHEEADEALHEMSARLGKVVKIPGAEEEYVQ